MIVRVLLGVCAVVALLFLIAVATAKGLLSDEMAAWVQAVFAVVAIGSSAWFFADQRKADRAREIDEARDTARTAGEMSAHALSLVAVRLEATLASETGSPLFNLRGNQTTEMVQAMRELDLGKLDPNLIKHFAYMRAGIYSINARISEIYKSERANPDLKHRRRERLKSAGRVLDATRSHFLNYQAELGTDTVLSAPDIPVELEPFLVEAKSEIASHADAYD